MDYNARAGGRTVNDEGMSEDQDALAQAHELIREQAEELVRLRRQREDESVGRELREALALVAAAGTIASPVSHTRLLEMIVETAAHVISARAAALFLIDEEAEELVFAVAIGPEAQAVKQFRVPLGRGIAGLVAVTGQPMAVSNARNDPRHATEIGQSVGHVPDTILCVPLYYNDGIIGVMELMDKQGAPSFGASDIDSLALFANQAAVAIEQSRAQRDLGMLLGNLLAVTGDGTSVAQGDLGERVRAFAGDLERDLTYRQSLDLAALVREIASQGEQEIVACQAILRGFAEYLRARSRPADDLRETW